MRREKTSCRTTLRLPNGDDSDACRRRRRRTARVSRRDCCHALRSASGHRRRCASSLSRTRKHGLSATRRAHVEERGQAHLQDPLEQARPGADARGAQVGPVRTQPLSQCPHARQHPQHEGRNKHRAGSIHCITLQLVCVCVHLSSIISNPARTRVISNPKSLSHPSSQQCKKIQYIERMQLILTKG